MERTTRRTNPAIVLALALALVLALLVFAWFLFTSLDPAARAAAAARAVRDEQLANQLTGVDLVAGAAWRLLPLALVSLAACVGAAAAWRRWVTPYSVARHFDVLESRALHQHPSVPASLTYSPHIAAAPRELSSPAPAMLTNEAPPHELPGPVDLAALDFTPRRERILLGMLPGGELATANIHQLCHVALCGATGGGKSNLLRLIIPQLQAVGAKVVLCDPHYAPLDAESGDDWRAIERRLHMAPAVHPDEIQDMFSYMLDELARRLDARRRGERLGPPMFLAFDELPVIVKHVKGGADALANLLREGRKVHILTVGASQDFLTKTIGSGSGVRDCYRTAFYVGGDMHSAAALLDMPRREIDDSPLGGGMALLRSNATPARLVRVPLASNAGIAALLGDDAPTMPRLTPSPATSWPTSPAHFTSSPAAAGEVVHEAPPREVVLATSDAVKPLDVRAARVRDMLRQKASQNEIIKEMWGVTSGKGYQQATDEYRAILADLVNG